MRRGVVAVGPADDREDVARVFRRHGYLALPVVDAGARLVGVVTADDVMNAIEAGATDDVQRMFGAGPEERLTSPWHFSYRKRLPWLLVNLALATAGASVVGGFEGTLGTGRCWPCTCRSSRAWAATPVPRRWRSPFEGSRSATPAACASAG